MDEAYRAAMIMAAIAQAQIAAAGMTAENTLREQSGLTVCYGENDFNNEVNYMNQRIDALRL